LLAEIRSGYFTRLTFPSVEEPLAASDEATRNKLFDTLGSLLLNGECLQAHNVLAIQLIQNYENHGNSRWASQYIRFEECENAIARREFSAELSEEQRKFEASAKDQFAKVFTDPKPKFEELFAKGTVRPTSADELLTQLNGHGGAFWNIGAGLYEKAAGRRPTEEQVRAFAEDCPPFLALMIALVHGQFEEAIREKQVRKDKRVNRIDLFCSIYLPYCDIYITDDGEQRRCLPEIATAAKFHVEFISFADFSNRLMPLVHLSALA
jgi:hypothetical protein